MRLLLPVCLAPCASLLLLACGNVTPEEDVLACDDVAGVLACNTFEAEDPLWTTLVDRGVAVLDESDPGDGAKALRATVAIGGGKAVRTRALETVDRYYARFLANLPTTADATGLSLMHLGEPVAPYLGISIEVSAGMLGVGVQPADVYAYPTPMPRDRWVCLELELVVSETGGRVILRADGATVLDRSGIDTRPAAGIGDLEVGLTYVAPEATAGTTVQIDEVVVAREPLPACPQ